MDRHPHSVEGDAWNQNAGPHPFHPHGQKHPNVNLGSSWNAPGYPDDYLETGINRHRTPLPNASELLRSDARLAAPPQAFRMPSPGLAAYGGHQVQHEAVGLNPNAEAFTPSALVPHERLRSDPRHQLISEPVLQPNGPRYDGFVPLGHIFAQKLPMPNSTSYWRGPGDYPSGTQYPSTIDGVHVRDVAPELNYSTNPGPYPFPRPETFQPWQQSFGQAYPTGPDHPYPQAHGPTYSDLTGTTFANSEGNGPYAAIQTGPSFDGSTVRNPFSQYGNASLDSSLYEPKYVERGNLWFRPSKFGMPHTPGRMMVAPTAAASCRSPDPAARPIPPGIYARFVDSPFLLQESHLNFDQY